MLTFRMDETNFADGDRAGVRIVADTGLKVDFDEFADDDDTLGLWHLHDGACQGEGTGLEDESGNGHDLTNHGGEGVEGGYRFVRADIDWAQATFVSQPARSQVTLDIWVRDWANPDQTYGFLASFARSDYWVHCLRVYAKAWDATGTAYIRAENFAGGTATWSGAEVYDLLQSGSPWHLAVVLDSPNSLRLFVNGVLRAEDTTNIAQLAAGNYTLLLGGHYDHDGTCSLSAVLDEVRLSGVARYASGFTPHRLLASGVYTGLTFDGVRIKAEWTDLARTQAVPPGCETTWDVRADDETDVNGNPQAVWQPYLGAPAALPDGRYFQWRATLEADADRLASPTVEAVEAVASEAGYNLYHATGVGPESLDYDEPWAQVGPSVTDIETDALAFENVHWFGIRPADPNGRESPVAQDEVRLETGAQGEQEPDRPAGALASVAVPLALGAARLRWRYRIGHNGVLPQAFRIFGDGGTGTIDYETPLDEVPWCEGQAWYAWTSDPLTPDVEHQLAVRAVTAGAVWDEQPAVARVTPDAVPPGQVDALEAEVTP